MSEDEKPTGSLADQAANWVPPWARPKPEPQPQSFPELRWQSDAPESTDAVSPSEAPDDADSSDAAEALGEADESGPADGVLSIEASDDTDLSDAAGALDGSDESEPADVASSAGVPDDSELPDGPVVSDGADTLEVSDAAADVLAASDDTEVSDVPGDAEVSDVPGDAEVSDAPGDAEVSDAAEVADASVTDASVTAVVEPEPLPESEPVVEFADAAEPQPLVESGPEFDSEVVVGAGSVDKPDLVSEPASAEPAVSEAAVSESASAEPAVSEAAVSESASAEPAVSVAAPFEPASLEPDAVEADSGEAVSSVEDSGSAGAADVTPEGDAVGGGVQEALPGVGADTLGEGETAPEAVRAEMTDSELRGAVEAILLVVDEPTSETTLAQVLEQPVDRVLAALEAASSQYTSMGFGFDLRRVAGGWRLYTRPQYAGYVEKFVLDGQQIRLTQAALETLAVVAYKQPVTRSRISAIRGVNCDGVVRTLVTRGLIEETGSEPESGAFLYRTTTLFLEKLGLDSVDQLPPLAPFLPDDIDEIADAQR